MRKIVLAMSLVSIMTAAQPLKAQTADSTTETKPSFLRQHIQRASAMLGTNGVSLEATRQVKKDALVNLALGYRAYQADFQQDWSKKDVTTSPDVSTAILGASYDWFPFLNHQKAKPFVKALKVKGGLQFVFNPEYQFTSKLSEDVKWGQMTFTQEEVGTMYTTVTTNKLQPFAAAGYDQFFTGKKYSFGADLGWVYQGKASVEMQATNMLEPTESQASVMEDNLKSWQFLPFVHLRFNYKF
jgi:hypothetical protein